MRYAFAAAVILLAGCRVTGYEELFRISDSRVDRLVAAAPYPDRLGPRERPTPPNIEDLPNPLTLDVVACVNRALNANRRLLETLEKAFVAQIDAELAAHRYWPILEPFTVASSITDKDNAARAREESASAGLSQRLPLGGSVDLTGAGAAEHQDGPETYKITPTVGVTIPLWKGAGIVVANNDLVDAARSARYARRELEQFKQTLAIDIVSQYYSLLQQKKAIRNFEIRLENAKKLRDQSEAMYRFGRVSKTDLFRAELQLTQAENDLLNARENLKVAEDQFKLELALPPEINLDIIEDNRAFQPLAVDEAAYLAEVKEKNILWQNTRDQFDDQKRRLHVAARELDPKLDLTGEYTMDETSEKLLEGYRKDPETWTAGIALEIPLDRQPLRTTYQKAVITFLQAERSINRSRDELVRQARRRMIGVRQAELSVRLQQRGVEEAEKAVRLLTYEYRQGKVANRDVIEAQNKLIAAQNALLRSLVDHTIARLELRQLAGTLEIDEEGSWLKP